MLIRREIENYLFDKELLKLYCLETRFEFDETKYNLLVPNVIEDDLKPLFPNLLKCCTNENIGKDAFCMKLAVLTNPETTVYKELKSVIFH